MTNKITYTQQGDYLLPDLKLPAGLRWRPLPQAEAPTEPTGETATFEIYQASPPNLIYKPADKLQSDRLPCRYRRTGRGYVLSVGKTTCRKRRCY